ncbi:transposase [Candidatus Dependentiae bacterium]|nr:transposase [Candidatus Dependentiae bacterium]
MTIIDYILLEHIRSTVLSETELVLKQCGTLRLNLIKIHDTLLFNTKKIKINLSVSYPYKKNFGK